MMQFYSTGAAEPEEPLISDDVIGDIKKQVDLDEDLFEKEEEKEDRRRGCCLVGCLLLFLLLLLFFLALFLPVKKSQETTIKRPAATTGAADWKLISVESYNIYKGIAANSKELYTVVKIKLTNVDSVEQQPNHSMILLNNMNTGFSYQASERPMVKLIEKNATTDPWIKPLPAGDSRIMTVIFSIPRPGIDQYSLLLKDFDWTKQKTKAISLGQIKVNISNQDVVELESYGE